MSEVVVPADLKGSPPSVPGGATEGAGAGGAASGSGDAQPAAQRPLVGALFGAEAEDED